MADQNTEVGIGLKVKLFGEHKIRELNRRLDRLAVTMDVLKSRMSAYISFTDKKWKKHFDWFDGAVKGMGMGLTKFVGMSAKFATIQVAALGAAILAVHAAFVLGNAAMKAFRGLAQVAAGGMASLAVAASTAAAAIREQQAAMFAYKGTGKSEFGKGINQIRVEMRSLTRDTDLAAVSSEALVGVFSEVSRTGNFTQGTQQMLKGLMDFASAGKPVEEGTKAAGKLLAALQDKDATFAKVKEAAKELGPEMENAIKELEKGGLDTIDEFKKAITDGSLAIAGGVAGQFAATNDTLIARGKAAFNIIKGDFADFGQQFLAPVKDALSDIVKSFRRAFVRVSGDLARFGQGQFANSLVGVFEKLENFFVKTIREYLPKTQGMFDRMGNWWSNFKDGWNQILETLRPLIDAAQILEETLRRAFSPVFSGVAEGIMDLRNLIVENRESFEEFGSAVGRFFEVFMSFSSALREIFVDALPFINKIIDGVTKLVGLFTSVLGKFSQMLGGGGGMGSFMLIATLLSAGRGMKNTIGGVVPSPKVMNVNAGVVNMTGATADGQIYPDSAAAAARMNDQAGLPPSSGLVDKYGNPIPSSGTVPPGGMKSQGQPGQPGQKAGTPVQAPGPMTRAQRRLAQRQNLGGLFDPNFTQRAREAGYMGTSGSRLRSIFRQQRDTRFNAYLMGNKELGIKGFNKSATGMGVASLGLGMLSGVAPESAQGALALGSAVGMFNPLLGLGVGLGGAALTSESPAFGALSGAGGGAAMGAMVGGPVGAVVGGVIGAAVGGIMGAINKAREEKKRAREAGRAAASNIVDGFMDGVSADFDRISERREIRLSDVRANMERLTAGLSGALSELDAIVNLDDSDERYNKIADMLHQARYGKGQFAGLSQKEIDDALKRTTDFAKETRSSLQEQNDINTQLNTIFNTRMAKAAEMFGMTEDQVFRLAQTTGTNLMDATKSLDEQMSSLAEGMIQTARDLETAYADFFGTVYDSFTALLDAEQAPLIIDEAARKLYDIQESGAALTKTDISEFFQVVAQQLPALAGGDTILAASMFREAFGPGGTAYGLTADGRAQALTGMEGQIYDLIGPLITSLLGDLDALGRQSVSELVTSNLATSGFQLAGDQAAIFDAAYQRIAEMSATDAATASKRLAELSSADLTDTANLQALADYVATLSGQTVTIQEAAPTIADAAITLDTAGEKLYAAATTMANVFGEAFSVQANVANIYTGEIKENPDTTTPKSSSIGDTGTNLSQTLDAHQRLSSMVGGKRIITSSYRNFALGSLNSDHVNGRAYDLIGDNLVSYKDAVKRDGGFAEFHGKQSTRHLHVVPRIGDSTSMPTSATQLSQSGATSSTPSPTVYNVTINGATANVDEIASAVMHRIQIHERQKNERR